MENRLWNRSETAADDLPGPAQLQVNHAGSVVRVTLGQGDDARP
jgi:hypothetical protein